MRKTLNANITIFKGATFRLTILVPDNEGEPIDLTGYTFEGAIATSTAEDATVYPFTMEVLDQEEYPGKVSWLMPADETAEIETSISDSEMPCKLTTPYIYNIIMTDTLGEKSVIIQGIASVVPTNRVTPEEE